MIVYLLMQLCMIKQFRFVYDIYRFRAMVFIIDNYILKVHLVITNRQTSFYYKLKQKKEFLTSRKGRNTPNSVYTIEQKTNYDPLHLITAAENLSVGAAVTTETLCLKQIVNVIRSTVSYFDGNCVFTTVVSASKANLSADYTLRFCWMAITQPTR